MRRGYRLSISFIHLRSSHLFGQAVGNPQTNGGGGGGQWLPQPVAYATVSRSLSVEFGCETAPRCNICQRTVCRFQQAAPAFGLLRLSTIGTNMYKADGDICIQPLPSVMSLTAAYPYSWGPVGHASEASFKNVEPRYGKKKVRTKMLSQILWTAVYQRCEVLNSPLNNRRY